VQNLFVISPCNNKTTVLFLILVSLCRTYNFQRHLPPRSWWFHSKFDGLRLSGLVAIIRNVTMHNPSTEYSAATSSTVGLGQYDIRSGNTTSSSLETSSCIFFRQRSMGYMLAEVPWHIVDSINSLDLQGPFNFTIQSILRLGPLFPLSRAGPLHASVVKQTLGCAPGSSIKQRATCSELAPLLL